MPMWVLEDDCLAPDRQLRIDFKGPNPFKVYGSVGTFLRNIFDVRGKDVWEREFRWDITSEPREFFSRFIVKKSYDYWSVVYAEVIMQGKQPSDPNKDGEMTVLLRSILRTESPENTILEMSSISKAMRWLYFRTLYNDVRRNLIEECRIKTTDLAGAIQKTLGIAPETVMR
ncbi:MAG: hypothetical protein HYW24_00450 [Candidatus Aenigmarchaeota archaeon]|nr:hypothetical protein [Candidatus Aenigmarchaeota archaeon]